MSAIQLIEPVDEAPRRAIATTATPADLLRIAVENGADLDRLERLMALQERWQAAEAERAYNVAFSAFKAEAVRIIKNRRVTDGPLKGKGYAELFAVVNAVTPALSAHGLHASWKLTKDERDWLEVTCTLKHVGGHSESVSMGGPPDAGGAKNAIQARASTVSYLERYTLKAITGLSEQEDDNDGGRGEEAENPLMDAGRDAAMGGMKPLTAWWGTLSARDRGALSKEFGALKRHAEQIDREAGRA
jgi:hypothetical protein